MPIFFQKNRHVPFTCGNPLRYIPPPMIRAITKKTIKTKPAGALESCAR